MVNKEPNLFGFESMSDFLTSVFRPSDWDLNFAGASIAGVGTFITGYIWDSSSAIYTLWALMAFDWATGIWAAIKQKEFVSWKLFRMPLYYFFTTVVLSLSYWISKSSLLFVLLPSAVYGGFISVYFISLLENLSAVGMLPAKLAKALKARFGLKAISEQWKKKNDV